jgi:DNA polymerase V
MTRMFALVDCNAFFVSCERVFQPHLERKPVIVLSSNDGCAISRSNEAKALGIPMGAPLFKIKDIVEKNKVHTFSPNFSLYADMSSRVMKTLKIFSQTLEVYSIDEAFLDLSSIPPHELIAYGCHIKQVIKKWTGIPVSVGIGPTKTLAKVANHLAKKHPTGCYTLVTPEKAASVLKNFPLQEVWGIGAQWSKKLASFGMSSALDLAQKDIRWIGKAFNVVLSRTALELRGVSCLTMEELSPPKKSMISSRSFGTPVSVFEDLREALSFHASSLAQKLRQQGSKTSLISVSIRTNPFDRKGNVYSNTELVPLPFPVSDTSILIKAAASALEILFREGLSYKKIGITVLNLSPENQHQPFLFKEMNPENSPKRESLLKTVDQLNFKHGKGSLVFASEGFSKAWKSKSSWKSPSFTQNWNQLMSVT